MPELRRFRAACAGLVLAACAGGADDRAASAGADSVGVTRSVASEPERLVQLGSGAEIWAGAGREARDSSGNVCVERALELRRPDGTRAGVPLLYTGELPQVIGDSAVRVHLWNDCRPGRLYGIDLQTAQPIPLPEAGG